MRLLGRYLNIEREKAQVLALLRRAQSEEVKRTHSARPARAPAGLTVNQNEEIVKLYWDGLKPVDIARELGTTEWTVHHRLDRMNVERRPMGMTDADARRAVELHKEGLSMRKIGQRRRARRLPSACGALLVAATVVDQDLDDLHRIDEPVHLAHDVELTLHRSSRRCKATYLSRACCIRARFVNARPARCGSEGPRTDMPAR